MQEYKRFGLRDEDELTAVIVVLLVAALFFWFFARGCRTDLQSAVADGRVMVVDEALLDFVTPPPNVTVISADAALDAGIEVTPISAAGLPSGTIDEDVRSEQMAAEMAAPFVAATVAPTIDFTENRTFQFGTALIEGQGEPNTDVEVVVDGQAIGRSRVDANGSWSYVIPRGSLNFGTHDVVAKSGDLSSNASTFTLNPPQAPRFADDYDSFVTPGTYGVRGSADANWQVGLLTVGDEVQLVDTDANGNWYVELDLNQPGTYELQALAINPDGTPNLALATERLQISVVDSLPLDGGSNDGTGDVVDEGVEDGGVVEDSADTDPADEITDDVDDGSGDTPDEGAAVEDGYPVEEEVGDATDDGAATDGDSTDDGTEAGAAEEDGAGDQSADGVVDGYPVENETDGSEDGAVEDGSDDPADATDEGSSDEGDGTDDSTSEGDDGTGEGAEGETVEEPLPSMAEQLAADGRFTTLLSAVDAAGLTVSIDQQDSPVTLFAPTDEALAQLPPGTLDALLADPAALQAVLVEHVVLGALSSADIVNFMAAEPPALTNLAGNVLPLSLDGNSVKIANSNVTEADIQVSNGYIHAIDEIILPPYDGQIPVIDVSGVPIFAGTVLTVVGTAEPNTVLTLMVNDQVHGTTTVEPDGTWLVTNDISTGEYKIVAYTLGEDSILKAISSPVQLTVE